MPDPAPRSTSSPSAVPDRIEGAMGQSLRQDPLNDARRRDAFAAIYRRTHRWVAVTWILGTLLLTAPTTALAESALPLLWTISLGSAAIAHLALGFGSLAVFWSRRTPKAPRVSKRGTSTEETTTEETETASKAAEHAPGDPDAMVAWLAGTLIRLLGTVALVGWCRYQMAEPERERLLFVMALGWYVVLTGVEVGVLARYLPRLDPPPRGLSANQAGAGDEETA